MKANLQKIVPYITSYTTFFGLIWCFKNYVPLFILIVIAYILSGIVFLFVQFGLSQIKKPKLPKISKVVLWNIKEFKNRKFHKFCDLFFISMPYPFKRRRYLVESVFYARNFRDTKRAYSNSEMDGDTVCQNESFKKMVQYANTYKQLEYLTSPEFKDFMNPEIKKQIDKKLSMLKL